MSGCRHKFFGRAYLYPTPLDDQRPIGVTQALGGVWIVAWFTELGNMHRLKSPYLQPAADPRVLQGQLDAWAVQKGLEPLDPEVRS